MLALIDADIVAYSCAIYNESFGWDACRSDLDALMRRILETVGASDHKSYITGKDNFRYDVYPDYKANRRGKPHPSYRGLSEEYLIEHWGAERVHGHEADDALGIAACRNEVSTVCSIDKDLLMIPGNHYNWRRDEFTSVSPVDGLRSFYRSLLVGDTVDNITGVARIGKVKASRLIDDLTEEADMFQICQALYNDDERLLMNGRLLWIWRKEKDLWEFPVVKTFSSEEEMGPVQE